MSIQVPEPQLSLLIISVGAALSCDGYRLVRHSC